MRNGFFTEGHGQNLFINKKPCPFRAEQGILIGVFFKFYSFLKAFTMSIGDKCGRPAALR